MKATVLWKDKDMDVDACFYAGEIEVKPNDGQAYILKLARELVCKTQIDIYVKMDNEDE